jgi:hypothetical protein
MDAPGDRHEEHTLRDVYPGIGPLAVFLNTLRYGAPMHPVVSGLVAGLLAGAVPASFYAAHCTDDSPLFVAIWYSIAIIGLAVAGALAPAAHSLGR